MNDHDGQPPRGGKPTRLDKAALIMEAALFAYFLATYVMLHSPPPWLAWDVWETITFWCVLATPFLLGGGLLYLLIRLIAKASRRAVLRLIAWYVCLLPPTLLLAAFDFLVFSAGRL